MDFFYTMCFVQVFVIVYLFVFNVINCQPKVMIIAKSLTVIFNEISIEQNETNKCVLMVGLFIITFYYNRWCPLSLQCSSSAASCQCLFRKCDISGSKFWTSCFNFRLALFHRSKSQWWVLNGTLNFSRPHHPSPSSLTICPANE